MSKRAKQTSDAGRDSKGRFSEGNPGGPGNPFNRRLARMRQAMIEAVSDEDLRAIIRQFGARARIGDRAAATFVFNYTVRKPVAPVNPDRVDIDEWQLNRERPQAEELSAVVMNGCPRAWPTPSPP